jgi:Cytochrome bd terminal oxidase subunit I
VICGNYACVTTAALEVMPARAQMATTLGFHIILACLGIALPTIVLVAEFIGLRRSNDRRPDPGTDPPPTG